jgi:hypothetical protein
VFCPRQEIFAPRVSQRIVRGPAVIGFEGRTHVYVAPPAYPAGARVVARPMPAGPPPVALRIDPSRVVRLTPREESVYTARRYALPSTARQVGARAPTPHVAPPRPAETRGARFPLGTAATQPPSPARPQPPQRIPAAPLPRAAPPVRAPPQTVPRRPAQTPAPGSQALPRPAPRSVSPSPGTPPAAVPRPPLRVPQRVPVPQRVAPAPSVHR